VKYQRYERMHELAFHRAYKAFVSGREKAAETGVEPGMPVEANEEENQDANHKEKEVSAKNPASKAAEGPGPGKEVTGKAIKLVDCVAPNEANDQSKKAVTFAQKDVNAGESEQVRRGDRVWAGAEAMAGEEIEAPPGADA
jgi:hypothetical protein